MHSLPATWCWRLAATAMACLVLAPSYSHEAVDSRSHLVKITTTIMIENDGNTPITHHLIDCDERNGHSRLSHIVAKLYNQPMPVTKTEDGRMWRIELASKPIEPGVSTPLMVTKVYTHLELVPSSDVYLMPYANIQYQVRIIKQGRPQKVRIPSEQYYLEVENRQLVDLDESTSTALALETEGSTKIRFIDKSVIEDEDFIQPESTIHIVTPSYLTMHVSPGNSWHLQKFTDYVIEIRIFDAHQHQIYPSDNLDLQLSTGSDLVVTNSTGNGTYHTVHTLNSGPSKLLARLQAPSPTIYSFKSPTPDIELVQELTIYEPLEIKPSAIVLPWLPELSPNYQVFIYADGGTGSYLWSTNNSALADITYTGDDSSMAKVTTHGYGTAFIQCTDTKSSVFLKHALIAVAKIVEINILPSITETELGGDIMLPVAVYANASQLVGAQLPKEEVENDLVLFHDCSKIQFDVIIVEKTRFVYDASDNHPNTRAKSCMSLKFTCAEPGSTRVWISYTDHNDPTSKPIKTTTTIACYKPLRPVYPAEVGVFALHTSIELAFEGGPRPLGSRVDDHYSYLEPANDPIITYEPIIDRYRYNKDLHVFRVTCMEYGEVSLTLNVGNKPSATLPNPASSKSSMKIICARPYSIQLRPRLKETCPLNEMTSLADTIVPVSTSSATDFEISVFDDMKRQFLNISSFSINWTLDGHGTIKSKQTEDINAVAGYRRITRNYITVQPHGTQGDGRLRADLLKYKPQGSSKGQTLDLSASLDIQFVDHAQINPNQTILYNHHRNVVILLIMKGSGYFSVESLQGAKLANVTYVSVFGQHRINITPLGVGRFTIRLEDQCIETSLGAPILSEIVSVGDEEFSREVTKPGRTLRYCREVDESMLCVFLSVDKSKAFPSYQSTTRSPPSQSPSTPTPVVHVTTSPQTKPPSSTTRAGSIEQPAAAPSEKPQSYKSGHHQATVQEVKPSPSVTNKVIFEDSAATSTRPNESANKTSIIHYILGYLIVLITTASAITLGYKWWQEQNKKQPNQAQFVTDSSFLRQSPAHSGSVRFSPSTSKSQPATSTPRTRPLYTERFSTTLLSD